MISARLSLLSLAILGTTSAVSYAAQTTPELGIRDKTPNLVALTNATVMTEPGKTVNSATVLIRDGKIEAVRTNATVPAGYQTIDLKGYHIYPGFIDPYTQYGVPAAAESESFSFGRRPVYENERRGGNAANDAIHAQQRWVTQFKPDTKAAAELLKSGFTTVQSARQDGIFRGSAFVASLADGLPNDLIIKADAQHFLSFSKGSSKQSYPSSLMGSVALIRQTLSDANWYQAATASPNLQLDGKPIEFNAALAALSSLAQQGVLFETSDERSLLRASRLLAEFNIKNALLLGSGYEYSRLEQVKATGQPLLLPLNFPAAPNVTTAEQRLDVNLADLRHWERAPANPAVLAQAGIPFALTSHGLEKKSDFLPNLRKAIQHGLKPEQALAALTTVPASLLGLDSTLGKVAAGYQADLVISRGDVFVDGEIVATWLRGQEKRFGPVQPAQFTGEYSLSFQGEIYSIKLTGTLPKLSGEASLGEKKTKLENIVVQDARLQFSLPLAALNEQTTVLQFNGVLTGNHLTGYWLDASGTQIAVSAVQQAAAPVTAKAAAAPAPMLSQLTFPNRAFGLATLPEQQNLHIKNATVWTAAEQGVLPSTDVLVRNGKFEKVGQNLATPRGYTVIDAAGMHLTPGIIDEHSHIATEQGVNEGSHANTAEVHLGDVTNPDDINIYRALAGGVTAVQVLHGSANPIGGQAQILSLRWGADAEGLKFKDAPPSIKFALGENVKQSNWGTEFNSRYPQSRIGVETFIRDQFQAAKEYQAAWQAYNKLSKREQGRVAPPRRDYQLDTLVEILEGKRHIHTHSYVASEILMLMQVADEMGFKVNTYTHILEGYKVASEMKAHGASVSTFADWWGFKMEVNDAIPTNTCLMHEQGLLVSVNSDDPGLLRRLNQEAAKSTMYCDMDEHEALKMVTINPAKQLKIADKVGSIEVGKQADFVLWDAEPLSVYAMVQQTWINGARYFDRQQDLALRQDIEQERQLLIQKVLTAGESARQGSTTVYKQDDPIWHCDDNDDWLKLRFGFGKHLHSHGHSHGEQH
ncbi:periplasmic amidohydrolase [Alishewanella longhuensis]|uniref:Periplasmic amidohydrolase n=1 Tax=Alishewanella longhuensis TaxID=1091037 RepID=A0ABQ3L0L0_9ALTE|nr:amidohydrolase family protein [Alishewanella longhuensis]GHG68872.1 periplasmic amidohydrolase [Alishewanella longhuensis]